MITWSFYFRRPVTGAKVAIQIDAPGIAAGFVQNSLDIELRHQYENQNLRLGPDKKPLLPLTKNYAGPVYIYDLAILRERFQLMQKALSGTEIYYAMKANSNPQILQELQKLGSGVDVVSGGEIRR